MSPHRRFRRLGQLWVLVGLVLFFSLLYKTGLRNVFDYVRAFGANFFLLLLTSGARHSLRTVAWHFCIEEEHRQIRFLDLFNFRLAGETITDLTSVGPVLGETARAVAVSDRMPLTLSASSVVVENLIYSLSVILFILSGVAMLIGRVGVPAKLRFASFLVGLTLIVPVLLGYLMIRRRWLLVSGLLNWMKRRGKTWTFLERREDRLKLFEENVYSFYDRQPKLFFLILLLEVLAIFTGVVEAYLILGKTTGHFSWWTAYLIESANRVVNIAFAFVPLRMGVDEGGTALTLETLGFNAATGVSLAIIRKIRILFWIAVGLGVTARYSMAPGLNRNRPSVERKSTTKIQD